MSVTAADKKPDRTTNGREERLLLEGEAHIDHLISLLELERNTEISETRENLAHLAPQSLQARGVCLLNLRAAATRTGLAGKVVVEFERNSGADILPPHSFRVGDVVGVVEGSGKQAKKTEKLAAEGEGVLVKVEDTRITVAFKEDVEGGWEGRICRMNKLANEITYKRMVFSLSALNVAASTNSLSNLQEILLGKRDPTSFQSSNVNLTFFNDRINDSQKEAVRLAVGSPEIALIHGPPGTGKVLIAPNESW
ncbi:uncharacterized protein EV422DRAFT_411537 [Fimicolochytrium jonesii]|uniref:uncharacterized protein n=1 Tax=Fimicolochytrium jonesii TaxID=1396493 RepID=UPI0022FE5E8F|nr:uncharacterized protein EV422DRAFT_411537 [Fimicolochytrium jonesii]KAI8821978.1 hypothetical protein EV422DRAFT_411537 [Fimicolochytrium jonesii]